MFSERERREREEREEIEGGTSLSLFFETLREVRVVREIIESGMEAKELEERSRDSR